MKISQINEMDLDINNMGDWPTSVKAVVILLLCVAVGFAIYRFDTSVHLGQLRIEEDKELQLRASLEAKQAKAVNLEAYEQQLAEMKESFGTMLRQLPDKTEVAALLVDVSQTGLAAGLEFELFQPEAEQMKDFYAELPIKVRVSGHYHEFGRFVSGLATLPRIVTIHDVKIDAPPSPGPKRGAEPAAIPLGLQATVKTYRYLDEAGVR